MSASGQKIFVFSNGEIMGDGLLKLPALMALRNALPDAEITWAGYNNTVYQTALVDITAPLNITYLRMKKPGFRPFGWFAPKVAAGKQFDIMIDTQRVFWKGLTLKGMVNHSRYINSYGLPPKAHFTAQVLQLFSQAVGRELTAPTIELPDPKWAAAAAQVLPNGKRYVGLVIGAGQAHKRWPADNFVQLGKALHERGFVPVILSGPTEVDLLPQFRAQLPEAIIPGDHDLGVATSNACFGIALAQRVDFAVANDGGGAHVAGAGKPNMLMMTRKASTLVKFCPSVDLVDTIVAPDFGGEKMDLIPYDVVEKRMFELLAQTKPRLPGA